MDNNQATSIQTENGAKSYKFSGCLPANMSFFYQSIRGLSQARLVTLLENAIMENPLIAIKTLFYIRDCRGGKGEKSLFRDGIRWLINNFPEYVELNMKSIPEYGSWKDLLAIFGNTEFESRMINFYVLALINDLIGKKGISLAGKWAPSEGSKLDRKHKYVEKFIRNYPGIKSKKDWRRKVLVPLRERLRIVEREMCAEHWDAINYSAVPSIAMFRYKKAFVRNDKERHTSYLEDVKSGKSKINSKIEPHVLVDHYLHGNQHDETVEMQWRTLSASVVVNGIAVVDVSGSMAGQPMSVAIAFGILLADKCGYFITFSENPKLLEINPSWTLQKKVQVMRDSEWGMNTNFTSVFSLLLQNHILPARIFVFSDMQFDQAGGKTNFDAIKIMYGSGGRKLPDFVFWNLRAGPKDAPVDTHQSGSALISGFSATLLKAFITNRITNPCEMMCDIVLGERYDSIILS